MCYSKMCPQEGANGECILVNGFIKRFGYLCEVDDYKDEKNYHYFEDDDIVFRLMDNSELVRTWRKDKNVKIFRCSFYLNDDFQKRYVLSDIVAEDRSKAIWIVKQFIKDKFGKAIYDLEHLKEY